jgi:hypothetical protein
LDDLRGLMIVDLPVISITLARTPVAQPTRHRRRISAKEGTDRLVALAVVRVKHHSTLWVHTTALNVAGACEISHK